MKSNLEDQEKKKNQTLLISYIELINTMRELKDSIGSLHHSDRILVRNLKVKMEPLLDTMLANGYVFHLFLAANPEKVRNHAEIFFAQILQDILPEIQKCQQLNITDTREAENIKKYLKNMEEQILKWGNGLGKLDPEEKKKSLDLKRTRALIAEIKKIDDSIGFLNRSDKILLTNLTVKMKRLLQPLQESMPAFPLLFAGQDPDKSLAAAKIIPEILPEIRECQQLKITDTKEAGNIKQYLENIERLMVTWADPQMTPTTETALPITPELKHKQALVNTIYTNYQDVLKETEEFNKTIASLNDADKMQYHRLGREIESFLLEIERLSYALVYEDQDVTQAVGFAERVKAILDQVRQLELNIPDKNQEKNIKKHAHNIETGMKRWVKIFESIDKELTPETPRHRPKM